MTSILVTAAQRLLGKERANRLRPRVRRFVRRLSGKKQSPFYDIRLRLCRKVDADFKGEVQFGPFKGFKFPEESVWGRLNRAGMLLGLYEREVVELVHAFSTTRSKLIDVGAGDGFFAVAAVSHGGYAECHAYELSELARDMIRATAAHNRVAENVVVSGEVDPASLAEELRRDGQRSVLLVDIEGGEFDLFTKEVIEAAINTPIIIEIHPVKLANDQVALNEFARRFRQTHSMEVVWQGARDPSSIPYLQHFPDDERWVICSEGRRYAMYWWVLKPLDRY